MFYYLENHLLLDPNDDAQLWCLHYVFLRIINDHLVNWQRAYIYHPLSSEHNKTPMQLWVRGLHEAMGSGRAEDLNFQVRVDALSIYAMHIYTVCYD